MHVKRISRSPDQTFNIGKAIGECLKGSEVILLSGELGSGKTLFTKGIASACNIDPDEVVSPSFTLMNAYTGTVNLFHFDLYRLGSEKERADPCIDEYLGEGLIVVEWAQFMDPIYVPPSGTIMVNISIIEEFKRQLFIRSTLNYLCLKRKNK